MIPYIVHRAVRRLAILASAAVLLIALSAYAAIKVWSNGEVIQTTDLNGNFAYITTRMVGGSGARLVNSDVSSSAGIVHSKLAIPALVPKAWLLQGSVCDGALTAGTSCGTPASSSRMTLSSSGSAGKYRINVTGFTPPNATYMFICTTVASAMKTCRVESGTYNAGTQTNIAVVSITDQTGGLSNSDIGILMLDTTNG